MFDSDDPIFTYTTEDAINDGMFFRLADMPEVAGLAAEAGIRVPVIVTVGVLEDVLKPPPNAVGEDLVGRTWDVLHLLAREAATSQDSMIEFSVITTMKAGSRRVKLWAFIEPASDGSPFIKIILPEEY